MESAMRTMEMKRTMTYSTMPKVPAPAMVYGPDYAGVRNEQPVSLIWSGRQNWGHEMGNTQLRGPVSDLFFWHGKSLES
jgi:hypothetical protein